jgi:hypothetical protein
MRVLLLQPEDSPRRGPWSSESWDLVVDLGKSSPYAAAAWSEKMRCRLLRSDSFSEGIQDIKRMYQILALGQGRLIDHEGIDWWSLRSLEILRETSTILMLQRMAAEIPRSATLWSTRPGWPANALAGILGLPLQAYGEGLVARGVDRFRHYARVSRHFSTGQLREIFLDKYDADYRWRARFAGRKQIESKPVVLIPSAYTNVSRVAAAYARLLPEQPFLLVATRRSATLFDLPVNVGLCGLGAYAETALPGGELDAILEKWAGLSSDLRQNPDLEMLHKLGVFETVPAAFAHGLAVRNAWRRVLEREPVCGVLCGDDTNVNTRLPVLLAARRGLPTLDFHHGALDGFYLVKQLPCDFYLAKNELERDYLLRVCRLPADRVEVGAPLPLHEAPTHPRSAQARPTSATQLSRPTSVVFFSEPYENAGVRTEEVYRELLPALCGLARETGRGIVLKLHPFESASGRSEIVQAVLAAEDCRRITIVSGPLSESLLSQTWAGVTVESTTVLDCALRGVPCFLCEWLAFSPFGYLQQYARFAAGKVLRSVEEVADIPRRLADSGSVGAVVDEGFLWQAIDPRLLSQWLGAGSPELAARRK